MRRKDRQMSESFALEVVDKCEYAVLSMTALSGKPYAVPITIVRYGKYIYFHSAKDGTKNNILKNNADVCVVCVGDTNKPVDKFTTEYESAIINGKACEVMSDEEKIEALRLLCERHTPSNMGNFDMSIEKNLHITAVWRIEISSITGKRKKYDSEGKEMKFQRMK